ncbi:hypothetical protein IH992_01855 [Candidatus Poribacteria bacterium]|nr:hypothetical protein [Candidatus Poribacteria bacterium]
MTTERRKVLNMLAEGKINSAVQDLAYFGGLSSLQHLHLRRFCIDISFSILKEMPHLRELTVWDSDLTDRAIADIGEIPKLDVLELSGIDLGDATTINLEAAIINFLKTPARILDFSACKITDTTLMHFADVYKDRSTPLIVLRVAKNEVSDAGIEHLLDSVPKEQIEELDFHCTNTTDRTLTHLEGMSNLRILDLGWLPLTDEGIKPLMSLPKLEELYINDTHITDRCIPNLATLKSLRYLCLKQKRTRISNAGVEKLRNALPPCQIALERHHWWS